MSALRLAGKSVADLKTQKFVVAGAGSAGIGVVNALSDAMVMQVNFWPFVPARNQSFVQCYDVYISP